MCKALSQAAAVPRNAIRQAKNMSMLLSISQNSSGGESQMPHFTTAGELLGKSTRKTLKYSWETLLYFIEPYQFFVSLCVGSPCDPPLLKAGLYFLP